MDNKDEIEFIKGISLKIIKNVEKSISHHINDEDIGKVVGMGADGTPTKKIDVYAEKKIIKILKTCEFITYLISEESGELKLGNDKVEKIDLDKEFKTNDLKGKLLFVVDPLDGTNNALKQIPVYGISIAVAKIKDHFPTLEDIKYGFIKDFSAGDYFQAIKDQGAYLNGKKFSPSTVDKLRNVSMGGYFNVHSGTFELIRKVRRFRVLGSVAIESAYTSCGKYDVFMDLRRSRILDFAAAKIIIEEAGSIISDKYGNKLKTKLRISEKVPIIASANEKIHQKVLDHINKKEIYSNDFNHEKLRSVGVVSRLDNDNSILLAGKIIQDLIKNNIDVKVETRLAIKLEEFKKGLRVKETIDNLYSTKTTLYNYLKFLKLNIDFKGISEDIKNFETDILITLGGDGTILMTKNKLSSPIPIFAINMGTVGFLTEVDIEELDKKLNELYNGHYFYEKRNQIKVSHDGRVFHALNEAVFMTERPAKMLHFQVSIDGKIIEDFRADGMILSTPSGSTAYSMSAGGPIVDPNVDAFIIIPICPYSLSIRPLVVSNKSTVEIKLLSESKKAVLVMDGQITKNIKPFDLISFEKSNHDVYFVKTNINDFYQNVKSKLMGV
ncbi:bifunctional NADP phosphatase/NAD kinase [Methanobrevibacter curvatus]|uniref:NAD kinase n=1 Tax=Methanobrevibacter curvatus TaxID=49547 RepID=A0A166CI10_9EURY|nr:bifunctional NADP phosphatase/NAD kinase [Methanobrevibacter curvatus]KZX14557.1 NAD kinase [Methanobrevibacter curvatus]